jgi:hypothetical protein
MPRQMHLFQLAKQAPVPYPAAEELLKARTGLRDIEHGMKPDMSNISRYIYSRRKGLTACTYRARYSGPGPRRPAHDCVERAVPYFQAAVLLPRVRRNAQHLWCPSPAGVTGRNFHRTAIPLQYNGHARVGALLHVTGYGLLSYRPSSVFVSFFIPYGEDSHRRRVLYQSGAFAILGVCNDCVGEVFATYHIRVGSLYATATTVPTTRRECAVVCRLWDFL